MTVDAPVKVAPARFVTIELASMLTGLTEKAIRRKIGDKVWREKHEYRRAEDGRVYIDLEGYERWVAKDRALNYAKSPSALASNSEASGAEKPSTSPRRRPTRNALPASFKPSVA